MKSQPIPEYPWQFVNQDLCEFESGAYLITTDHFSDFIEVDELDNTLSSTIAQKTEAHITRHGLPEMILSDNGPQFIGTEYKQLCQKYQIQHITSSPYWPQGNGKSEASVKIVKRILKKSGKHNLNEALLLYQNTPQVGHTLTPAQRSMGRRLRCMLPTSRHLLLPRDGTSKSVTNTIAEKRATAKHHYDTRASSPLPTLHIGDFVYAKPSPHHKSGPWLYGLVTAIPSPRSNIVETPSGLTRRNRVHLRQAAPPPPDALVPKSWMKTLPMRTIPTTVVSDPPSHQVETPKRPQPIVNHATPEMRAADEPSQLASPLSSPRPSARSPTSLIGRKKDTPRKIEPSPLHTQENTPGKAPTITRAGRVSKPVIRLDL